MTTVPKRYGIVAGNGLLPVTIADKLSEHGDSPVIVCIEGEADLALGQRCTKILPLEKIAYCLPLFKSLGVTHVVFAGGVRRRPKPSALRVPISLWPEIPGVVLALTKGDDGLLAALVKMFERHGLSIVGAHQVLPDHVAAYGAITGKKPGSSANQTIRAGVAAAAVIGVHDIGQAVVAMGRRVIAVEGIEGTDQMLARIKQLRIEGRISADAQPVLIKLAKPGQELRADMPVIGPATIEGCIASGIQLICISAGSTLIMDVKRTFEMAGTAGISIIGIDPAEWTDQQK